MSPTKRYTKKQTKARLRRRLKAHEHLTRHRRQTQHTAEVLRQVLDALRLPEDLVAEIAGRLRSQQKLLDKIFGVVFPPLFGCRTNTELCRVRGWDKNLPNFNRQSSVMEPHAYSPIPPNFFELERWVSWVSFQNFIILISQLLHRLWQRFIGCPKRGARKVIHNFFVRPAL
jgi:hypothetical protein